MRQTIIYATLIAVVVFNFFGVVHGTPEQAFLGVPPFPHQFTATVTATPRQTFAGVGGSGAWWPPQLYEFPETVRRNVSRLLFSPEGLGITSYRWNLGGGGQGVSDWTRAPETFYLDNANFNWSADPQGVYFAKAAAEYGVPHIAAFVNSAPTPFTSNGKNCGGSFVKGMENAYAKYLVDVISHFREDGIPINLISPMNEPTSAFGNGTDCRQEGMAVHPLERAAMIEALHTELERKELEETVGIIADESNMIKKAMVEDIAWLPRVQKLIVAVAHHTYDYPTDKQYSLYVSATGLLAPNTPLWMTEICCSGGTTDAARRGWKPGYDPTIERGLHFASLMLQSFIVASEPHYDFWTLVSDKMGCSPFNQASCSVVPNELGWTDGLIYIDPEYRTNGNHKLYLAKHFWTFKHFANFVKPGARRHEVTGIPFRVLAVEGEDGFIIIALNPSEAISSFSLVFEDPRSMSASASYRTSAFEDFASVDLPQLDPDGSWDMLLPRLSITSFVFTLD